MFLKNFKNLGIIIGGVEIPVSFNLGKYEYDKEDALQKLIAGFPSIKIPEKSDSVFWKLNGNNFGYEAGYVYSHSLS